jgi:hypothetical protein
MPANGRWDLIRRLKFKKKTYHHIYTQWEEKSFPFKEKAYSHIHMKLLQEFFPFYVKVTVWFFFNLK